jgi:putative Holliday junction resolvase
VNQVIENINDFKKVMNPGPAILGIDYGAKRMGAAVSDLLRMIATPYGIIRRTGPAADIRELGRIAAEKEIGGLVYGLPLQMNGVEGEIAAEVRKFADEAAKTIRLPYFFWDERLSSAAVERFLIKEVDMNRKRRKEVLDAAAAAYILQGFLDALGNLPVDPNSDIT